MSWQFVSATRIRMPYWCDNVKCNLNFVVTSQFQSQLDELLQWQRNSYIYRVSQEEWTNLRKSVPYVKIKDLEKEGKESDYWGDLKKKSVRKIIEKHSEKKWSENHLNVHKSVVKWSEVKWSEGKCSEVQRREGVKVACNGKDIYGW